MAIQKLTDIKTCRECGSLSLSWAFASVKNNSVPDGRLRMNEVSGIFYLGCDECSETLTRVSADDVAALLNAAPPVSSFADAIGWQFIRFTDLSKNQQMKCKIAWTDGYNSVVYDEEGAPRLLANWAFEVLEGKA